MGLQSHPVRYGNHPVSDQKNQELQQLREEKDQEIEELKVKFEQADTQNLPLKDNELLFL